MNVVAVFDIGKTNKKLFLFDEQYHIVWEKSEQFAETQDEDGDPCENLAELTNWVMQSLAEVMALPHFVVKAVNFSTYGASFVYVDENGQPLGPLYNYLKAYPGPLLHQFFAMYGGEAEVSRQTASPSLGSLNSGLQLYRVKHEQPAFFARLAYALHLPQYVSHLISRQPFSDLTSIGCHTMLWDFDRQQYHHWVVNEQLDKHLAPIVPADSVQVTTINGQSIQVGVGLHDSSSAMIPYLASFQDGSEPRPFVLISTGTWCISMNPFNNTPLTSEELQYDCLNFMQYKGQPVKSARLFAGYEHEQQVKRLAAHFGVSIDQYMRVGYQPKLIHQLQQQAALVTTQADAKGDQLLSMKGSLFSHRNLADFTTYDEAYHQLILDIISQQIISTNLVLAGSPITRLFVDGGFSKNPIYMNLLATAFPQLEVYAASVAQASALGAALAIHTHWNPRPLPQNCVELKRYAVHP